MADEPENRAMAMLCRLEARLERLTEELCRVKGRLAHVESVLERLMKERGPLTGDGAGLPQGVEHVLLNIAAVSPPLAPGEEQEALAEAVRIVRARREGVRVLTDEERAALDEALRGGIVSQEEVDAFRRRRSNEF